MAYLENKDPGDDKFDARLRVAEWKAESATLIGAPFRLSVLGLIKAKRAIGRAVEKVDPLEAATRAMRGFAHDMGANLTAQEATIELLEEVPEPQPEPEI